MAGTENDYDNDIDCPNPDDPGFRYWSERGWDWALEGDLPAGAEKVEAMTYGEFLKRA